MRTKKGAIGIALGAVVALASSACGGGTASTGTDKGASQAPGGKGGTLYFLTLGPVDHWDPQRIYTGTYIEFANRVFSRTLTTFGAGTKAQQEKLVPDMATDTGTMSDAGKTWKFTLKDGIKWQDGSPVTCEDVKYGISRTFAVDVITGGPNYAVQFFDIPAGGPDGGSSYAGPYKKTGQDLYDKAVSCAGQTITFKMKKPWADFNQATTFPAFTAFKKSQDKGDKSNYETFSDGPYMLKAPWESNKGGTFVRNPNWDPKTDTLRKANPDSIVYQEGIPSETVVSRIMADAGNDKFAVTDVTAPPALMAQIVANPALKDRTTNPAAPYVDYVQPNLKSEVFKNAKAREAFAMSTDRDGYIAANGGPTAMTPTNAMVNKELPAYKAFDAFGVPTAGDPVKAKAALVASGLTLPVPITVAYRKTPTADKAYAALAQGWEKAGFKVTLDGIADKYYPTIQGPASATKYDAFRAGWGADWPSGSTVVPPLFDGRVNITSGGSGQDYGYFNDPEVNKAIDAAYLIADTVAREKAWGDIDEMIVKKVGVVPLSMQKFMYVRGSGVKSYQDNTIYTGYVDLAQISVK